MSGVNVLVFDTETTGFNLHPEALVTKQPRCIEFGAVLATAKGKVIEEISILINPGEPISEEITKITGITDADVAGAKNFEATLPELRRIFAEAGVVVAHNLPFDKAIIRGELARLDVLDFPWPEAGVCTVGLYRDLWGRQPRLIQLYEKVMGKPLAQTHRALDDVKAMVEIIDKEELWPVFAAEMKLAKPRKAK